MNDQQLMNASQARANYQNAVEAYLSSQVDPQMDTDDVFDFYQAMRRAELKMRSFDVV